MLTLSSVMAVNATYLLLSRWHDGEQQGLVWRRLRYSAGRRTVQQSPSAAEKRREENRECECLKDSLCATIWILNIIHDLASTFVASSPRRALHEMHPAIVIFLSVVVVQTIALMGKQRLQDIVS